VRSSEGCLGGALIHFRLTFPQTYPLAAPTILLYTRVPHPNVSPVENGALLVRGVRQPRFKLAMYDCIPGQSSWSPAYSVQSVLVQLQGECHDGMCSLYGSILGAVGAGAAAG
jgi:ubiquitin-protein ligase